MNLFTSCSLIQASKQYCIGAQAACKGREKRATSLGLTPAPHSQHTQLASSPLAFLNALCGTDSAAMNRNPNNYLQTYDIFANL